MYSNAQVDRVFEQMKDLQSILRSKDEELHCLKEKYKKSIARIRVLEYKLLNPSSDCE